MATSYHENEAWLCPLKHGQITTKHAFDVKYHSPIVL